MDILTIIKNNPTLTQFFDTHYPDLNIEIMEDGLVKDIIESILGCPLDIFLENLKFGIVDTQEIEPNEKELNENYDMADKNIPEMLLPSKMIYLNGKINNTPLRILVDTGASTSCIYKSKAYEAGLENIIDKRSKMQIQGVNACKESHGVIWYVELELELSDSADLEKKSATVGMSLVIVDDVEKNDKIEDNLKQNDNNIEYKDLSNGSFDILLGLNFMKSYGTVIDFKTSTITLNNTIKIKFD